MALSLSHIAEDVFAEIVNRNTERFLSFCNLTDQADLEFIRRTKRVASCEAPLARFGERVFDGACRIDVLVRLRSDVATAFELKLGHTRLNKTRIDRWLQPCKASHGDRRWSGNVMAVLDRRFPDEPAGDLIATPDDASYRLTAPWFVVARRRVLHAWELDKPCFTVSARFLAFEDVVNELVGPDGFNAIVRELVDFDFYEKWRLSGGED